MTSYDEIMGKARAYPNYKMNILTGGSEIPELPLTEAETSLFYEGLAELGRVMSLQSTELSKILYDKAEFYLKAAGMAKGSIGTNPTFGGVSASGSEIGMSLIRAIPVMSTATTEVLNWVQNYTASGWANVFGSAGSPVDLSTTGIAQKPATNLQNRLLLAAHGLIDPVPSPQFSEVRLHINQKDYGVQPVSWLPMTDFFYSEFQAPIVIGVNQQFYMRGNVQPSSTGGQDGTQLYGLMFAPGVLFAQET